jgi:sterol 3beta-glucosyltransferase
VIPDPPEWTELRPSKGYWFLDRPAEWRPPEDLASFIESGAPPIYAGFGSMAGSDGERLTGVVLEALRRTGRRGIIAAGWGGLRKENLPPYAFPVESVPHDWLFTRVAAAIHHGGAGTTAAALRAGAPSIIVPFFADQSFWGKRVFELGLGPKPISRKKLDAESLTDAVRFALEAPGVRDRCLEMAHLIQGEDGVEKAARLVESYLLKKIPRVIR